MDDPAVRYDVVQLGVGSLQSSVMLEAAVYIYASVMVLLWGEEKELDC